MRFYTTERLSGTRSFTPEGFLLCVDVPMARTGVMEYAEGEIPVAPKPGERVSYIHRNDDEVFSPKSLASYAGKPLVNEHPPEDVTPANWRELAMGIVMNPRRGTGDQSDLVVGDILVTCPDAIKLIEQENKVELSAGYDADYEQLAPGEGLQRNIIINHVALVAAGRCGSRCSIGDDATIAKKDSRKMSTLEKMRSLLARAYTAKTADELAAVEREAEGQLAGGEEKQKAGPPAEPASSDERHIHVHIGGRPDSSSEEDPDDMDGPDNMEDPDDMDTDTQTRLTALEDLCRQIAEKLGIGKPQGGGPAQDDTTLDDETVEGKLEMEAPPGTGDKARKSRDSSYLATAWQNLLAQVEIVTPGAKVPTFDRAARPAVTYDALCGMRTETLVHAHRTRPELARFIDSVSGGSAPDFKAMTCDSAKMLLGAVAAEAGRLQNKGGGSEVPGFGTYAAQRGAGGGAGVAGPMKTPADLNAAARKLYGRA